MKSTDTWIFSNVEIDGAPTSCRISGGVIREVRPDLRAGPDERVVHGRGAALLPGLADHHLHLWATAAAQASYDLDGAYDLTGAAANGHSGWLRIIGAGRLFDRAELDRAWPDQPVRVQHRSGALWMLNTAALDVVRAELDADERRTGQLWRNDLRWRAILDGLGASVHPDLPALASELARLGITHVSDATPDAEPDSVNALRDALPQHILSMSRAQNGRGPVKLVIADHEPLDFADLTKRIGCLHETGRPVAVHAVTQVALAATIAALREVGTLVGDRVEHAAVCDDALADCLAELGITVVTQPGIWARRGLDFLAESPPDEHAMLWRYASLVRRGVRVAISSDAPYGPLDPWTTIQAAATRDLATDGSSERVSARTALWSMLTEPLDPGGRARRIEAGARADLILLNSPLDESLATVVAGGPCPVRLTVIAGQPTQC